SYSTGRRCVRAGGGNPRARPDLRHFGGGLLPRTPAQPPDPVWIPSRPGDSPVARGAHHGRPRRAAEVPGGVPTTVGRSLTDLCCPLGPRHPERAALPRARGKGTTARD